MSNSSCKILYNGARNLYAAHHPSFVATKVEPVGFHKIYLVIAHSKPSSYSEGLLRKQIEKIIDGRIPLKEAEVVYTFSKSKKSFITTAEYWNRQHQIEAINDAKRKAAELSVRDAITTSWQTVDTIIRVVEEVAKEYPDILDKYRPYMAALAPEKYQFLQESSNSLSFPIHRSQLEAVRSYATIHKYSFKVDELELWPKEPRRWSYSQADDSPIGNRIVVTFAADLPKRLVIIRMKALNWLDKVDS